MKENIIINYQTDLGANMNSVLENYLWENIHKNHLPTYSRLQGKLPREVINEMLEKKLINSPKQAWRTLEKWMSQGKYDYGVSLDLGWGIIINHQK